ncbi:MAG: SRPBCC family protein [Gemmatimonadota bacterium]|nr:MAG: SRPBCC family protein [Gemmatimonadota bacterium]
MHYSKTVLINRSVAEVFAYMDDISREREWQPNIRETYQDPPGPTAIGTKKTYVSEFMGKSVRNTYVTKVFEPNVHVRYETTKDSTVQGTAGFRWDAEGSGTKVTMTFEGKPKGVLRFVPEAMLAGLYQQELEATLERLKQALEN